MSAGERQILLTRRAATAHQGGLWEFPGGKVEVGETVQQALVRELREELAIEVGQSEPLLVIHHDYGDKFVKLDVHLVHYFEGGIQPQEGQPMAWVPMTELAGYALPAANRAIVKALERYFS